MKRKVGYMSFDTFKKIVDEISQYPYAFLLIVGEGEASLHKEIEKMFYYAKEKKVRTHLCTNGLLLEIFSPEKILDFQLESIGISFDGFDEKTFNARRRGANYNVLKNNIKSLYNYKKANHINHTDILIRNVIYPQDTHTDIINFKTYWEKNVDKVRFNTLTFNKAYDNKSKKYKKCAFIKFEVSIRWDGSFPLCSHHTVFMDEISIGNVNNNSIKELWNHPKLKDLRKSHKKGQIEQIFCAKCHKTQGINEIERNMAKYNTGLLYKIVPVLFPR